MRCAQNVQYILNVRVFLSLNSKSFYLLYDTMGILILKIVVTVFSKSNFHRNSTFYLLDKERPELILLHCEVLFTSGFNEFTYMLKHTSNI